MHKLFYLVLFLLSTTTQAQQPEKLNATEIYKQIQNLNFLGSVLYVAAHPDDENTRLISYLSNEVHARTAYLSLTRGDGGQNLIGPELGPLLGIIRTQELLAARRIDGGHQFFTRANDFGYSKHPEETLSIWNEEEVLKDVVQTIRRFKPDIIINRFDHTTPGTTHGHHTSSAILSVKAFNIAGEASAFSKQLKEFKPWQPRKLFNNTSPWFYESQEAFENAVTDFISIDTGVYFPLLGLSNTEISSLSRSQHQSQGFGSTGSRGAAMDYLKLIAGEHPPGSNELFEGINTTWSRVKGGQEIGQILRKVEENFDFQDPSASIPELLQAYGLILQLENEHWKKIKSQEIKEIIAASAGIFLESVASQPTATKGEGIHLDLEAINRSSVQMELASVEILPLQKNSEIKVTLAENENWRSEIEIRIPETAAYTTPYWLKEEASLGMYQVEDPSVIGLPETPLDFKVLFNLHINGIPISFERPIVYKENDPVKGEVYRPFEIVPKVSALIPNEVTIFADDSPKVIPVILKAQKAALAGNLKLMAPEGWKISPSSYPFTFDQKGEEKTFFFNVKPPKAQTQDFLTPIAEIDGETYSQEILTIDYEHIPAQTVLLPSAAKVVKLDIQKRGELIGYIHGAGDAVPQSLEQIGYKVSSLAPDELSSENLEKFDAVVVGIRAHNTVPVLRTKQQELLEYVRTGGNLIVQYNTNRGLYLNDLAPYPLKIGRGRVTDENAEVRFLAPSHELLNFPNKITSRDFEGWVQERGLYFPETWDESFTAVLSMNDAGEQALNGSLLVAPYGKGNYIYTGLSFFRELPAGVPGAYRLFANLVSLTSRNEPQKENNHSN